MLGLGTACGDTVGGGEDEASGETSEPSDEPCDCDENVESWQCECFIYTTSKWEHQGYYCDSEEDAFDKCADWCQYHVVNALDRDLTGPIGCQGQGSSANCQTWDPASEVLYHTGTNTYYLLWSFVWNLVANPDPLWGCDDATILLEQDGFTVADANSGELLYELGLRNGDVIKSINSINLDTYADVGHAFSELFSNGATDYTLEIERSSTPVELQYNLAVSF